MKGDSPPEGVSITWPEGISITWQDIENALAYLDAPKPPCSHKHQRIDLHEDDYERLVRCICLLCGKTLWSRYAVKA